MVLHKLEQRELDVILGFPGSQPERLPRGQSLLIWCMFWIADGKFATDGGVLGKKDLADHPIISYEVRNAQPCAALLEYMPRGCFEDSVVHYSNSLGTTISMVAAGVGISVLPPIVIQDELRSGVMKVLNVNPTFSIDRIFRGLSGKLLPSRLAPLIASIAAKAAADFCALYDRAVAYHPA